ncbi:MAG: hypothetical protein QM650_15750 [Microlunatus sp.]
MAQGSIVTRGSITAVAPRVGLTRSVRLLVAGVLAAIVVLLASGCAVEGSPNTVAYIGDERITQQQLDTAVESVQAALGADEEVSPLAVVNVKIQGAIANQVAAQRKIPVTDAQRDALLADTNLKPLLADPVARQVAYDIATPQIVAQAVGSDTYLRDLQAADVTLNPRFGVLDPATKTIIDGQSASLSLPPAGS